MSQSVPQSRILTLNQFSNLTGYDINTARKWIRAGMPAEKDTAGSRRGSWKIDLREAIEWKIAQEVEKVSATGGRVIGSKSESEARKAAADADMAEYKLAQIKGEVVRNEDAIRALETILSTIRAVINGIPGRFAADLALESDAPTVERMLRRMCNEILAGATDERSLAAALGVDPDDIPDDDDLDEPYYEDE